MFCMQECVSEAVWLHFHEFGIFKLLCMWMQVFGSACVGVKAYAVMGLGGVWWKRVGGFYRWSVPSGTAGSHYPAVEYRTQPHTDLHTLSLTLVHHWPSRTSLSLPLPSSPSLFLTVVVQLAESKLQIASNIFFCYPFWSLCFFTHAQCCPLQQGQP